MVIFLSDKWIYNKDGYYLIEASGRFNDLVTTEIFNAPRAQDYCRDIMSSDGTTLTDLYRNRMNFRGLINGAKTLKLNEGDKFHIQFYADFDASVEFLNVKITCLYMDE